MSDEAKARKKSSVRHTRAIQRDRSKRPSIAPPDDAVDPSGDLCSSGSLFGDGDASADPDLAGHDGLCAEPDLAASWLGCGGCARIEEARHVVDGSQAGIAAGCFGTIAHFSSRVVLPGADGHPAADAPTLESASSSALGSHALGIGPFPGRGRAGWFDLGYSDAQGLAAAGGGWPGAGRADCGSGQCGGHAA